MTTKMRCYLGTAAVLAALATASPAAAQYCAPREKLVEALAQHYGERREALGLTDSGQLLELYVSAEGGWTIAISDPRGTACVVATGTAWQEVPLPVERGPEA